MLNKISVLFIGFTLALGGLQAQVTSGTIVGSIHDPAGAVLPAVEITVRDTGKNVSQTVKTNANGDYSVQFLNPGTYRVFAEMSGFRRQESQDVILNVDQTQRIDFTMQVGDTTQTVEVTAVPPLVDTETSGLGQVIAQAPIRNLPLNGRNFATLVYLVPGVTTGQAGENLSGNSTYNPRAASDFNALGSQATANAWVIDGITDSEYTFNTVMIQASVESIGEFKVLTGTFSAEFGRGAGVVSVSTKSGSNQFHGDAFEYLRDNTGVARNYFNNPPGKLPPFQRNQYGATLGGPIFKDKLFFFTDYYGERQVQGGTFITSVPTALERVGNFSDWTSSNGSLIQIYNPFNQQVVNGQVIRQPFAGNIIPQQYLNQVGLNVASIYPLPNLTGTQNNYTSTLDNTVSDNGGNARVDYHLNDKDSAFVRFSYEDFIQFAAKGQSGCCIPTPPAAAAKFDLGPFISGGQNTDLKGSGLALSEVHVFSPTIVNEFLSGFSRLNTLTLPSDYGHQSATSLGIQGINLGQASSGLPVINITNYTAINGGPSILPVHERDTAIQFSDTLSWNLGRHGLKFGYRLVLNQVSPFAQYTSPASITFGTNFTNNAVTNVGGNGMATLLLGYSTVGSRVTLPQAYYMRSQEHSGFVQDDWKVDPRLTLNLGLRYDVYTPDHELSNRFTNLDLTALTLVYAGVNGVSRSANVSTQYGNLGPRIGFAYDVTGKGMTVVRGGYGIAYINQGVSGSQYLGGTIPWAISQNYNPENYPTTFSNVPTINQPFPMPTVVQPMTTAQLDAINPTVYGHAFKNLTPSYQSWSLNVQRQLSAKTLVEVGYAGSRGVHLEYCYLINELQPGPGSSASRRLIQPLSNDANLYDCEPRNQSNYNGGQVKLTHQLSRGLEFLSSYTYSKSLDYGGAAGNPGMGGDASPQTITNLAAAYGASGFDTKHRFVQSWLYQLPFGKDRQWLSQGFVSAIVGGWSLDGIATVQTGNPFTVTLANGVNNGATSWPNRIASGKLSNRSAYLWFNPAAFVAPPQYHYGNSARGVLYGPGVGNVDLSVDRTFAPIGERVHIKLRLDAFNSLNTPHFALPNAAINPTAPPGVVGRITSTNQDNRELQGSIKIEF